MLRQIKELYFLYHYQTGMFSQFRLERNNSIKCPCFFSAGALFDERRFNLFFISKTAFACFSAVYFFCANSNISAITYAYYSRKALICQSFPAQVTCHTARKIFKIPGGLGRIFNADESIVYRYHPNEKSWTV